MPYSGVDDTKLPSYIKNKPEVIRAKWIAIFNSVYRKEGEEIAFITANKWLKRHLKKVSVEAQTTKAPLLETIVFELNGEQLIKQTSDGEEYIDFVLVDDKPDKKGNKYPDSLLQKWAELINNGETFVGDIDHAEYDKIVSMATSPERAAELIRNTKKGIAKTLKAVYEKGKLWVRAIIDKRYKKQIENARGVSLEAVVSRDDNKQIVDGSLLGFTFAVNQDPVNPRAVIA